MSKTFFKIGLGLLFLAGVAWPAFAVVTTKTLPSNMPSIVAHLAQTGDVAATNDLELAIGLQLRNTATLDDLVRQVSDPSSPNYHHYLTTEEFTEQFAPTEADYQAVLDFAQANGLTVTDTPANRMLVEVTGKASAVEHAFNVVLHTYQHPTENRTFFAPNADPSVPANLVILDVSGLNNYVRPYSRLRLPPNATNAPQAQVTKLGSAPLGSYMGKDFRAAYVPGTALTGTGQNVALVQFDGYFASDIAQYEAQAGLPSVSLTNILFSGYSGFPVSFGGNLEVSLDIEMVVSMAPGVNQIQVYEGSPFVFNPNIVLNQIAVDNSARQISCSWGWTGGPDSTSDQIFKEMILQGQTFYDASGDSDAFLPGQVDNPGYEGFPSSDPYITQVGATTLSTTGPGGAYTSETVWNWGLIDPVNQDGEGSSGGISSYYQIPWWQTNVSMTANAGSTTFRNIPDVALTGDNVYVIASGGAGYSGVGGTSCASPLWAGFTALVNQQAASVGHAPVGFINPTLYALANSPAYTNVFRDVATGNNTWSLSPNQFYAVTNYDLCTGLGSPNGTNLINALASATNVNVSAIFPPPFQPWGNTLSVMNGANPNGPWLLFIQDDTPLDNGNIFNGWSVNLTSADPVGQAADNQLYVNSIVNNQPYLNATNISVVLGNHWITTLAATNYGPSFSSNVFVTDTLPANPGITLVSSTATFGSITNYGNTLVWSLANLPINAGGTLTLDFLANSTGLYTNSATVSALTTDPNPDDDSIAVIANVIVTTPPVILPRLALGSGGSFQLSISNDIGANIIIQASTNLMSWTPVYTNVSPFTFTSFDTTNYPLRFYRAVVGQ